MTFQEPHMNSTHYECFRGLCPPVEAGGQAQQKCEMINTSLSSAKVLVSTVETVTRGYLLSMYI